MPQVHIQTETDVPQGWRYVVEIAHDDGSRTAHRLRLAWVDHNHWAGERPIPPSRVVQALVEALVEALVAVGRPLPDRFDASTARRWVPDLDDQIAERL
ncbi:MAG: hypothetical protein IT431_08400 [Phycisphaerales bacterium]|nr:hypothetical protein [Phycisphaerales bacterium]